MAIYLTGDRRLRCSELPFAKLLELLPDIMLLGWGGVATSGLGESHCGAIARIAAALLHEHQPEITTENALELLQLNEVSPMLREIGRQADLAGLLSRLTPAGRA